MESKVWFADPTRFNDPFECRPALQRPTDAQIDAYAGRIGPRMRSKFANDGEFEEGMQAMRTKITDYAYVRKSLTANMRNIGTLCLVNSPLNHLMWSHYAEQHQGLCYQFNSTVAMKEPFGFASGVLYREDRPTLIPTELDRYEAFRWGADFIRTKSSHWAYEEEWRCFRAGGEGHVRFAPELLVGVFLGARIQENDAKFVLGLCLSHPAHPKVFQVEFDPRTYELVPREMSVGESNRRWSGQPGWWLDRDAIL